MVLAALKGQPVTVNDAETSRRIAICAACSFARHFPNAASRGGDFLRCDHPACGCAINGPVRCKACLATESCPDGKWVRPG
jgi:hypothetical protein